MDSDWGSEEVSIIHKEISKNKKGKKEKEEERQKKVKKNTSEEQRHCQFKQQGQRLKNGGFAVREIIQYGWIWHSRFHNSLFMKTSNWTNKIMEIRLINMFI